jgi:uncharacterized protein (TIGR02246 family)
MLFSGAVYAAPPSPADIHDLFLKWNITLQTGTPEDMAKLYAEDGILIPTVSNDVRENREEVADYFKHFQQLKPNGFITEEHIQILGDNLAVNSGTYTFAVFKDGKVQLVPARYTYVYEKIGNEWLIKDHHSSKMPEPVAALTSTPPAQDGSASHH